MPVEHNVPVSSLVSIDHVYNKWVLSLGVEYLSLESLNLKLLDVVINQLHGLLNETVGGELRIAHLSKVWHSHEVSKTLDEPRLIV